MLGELGDKIGGDLKARVQASLEELKSAVSGGNIADIKAKMESHQKVVQEAGAAVYQQAQAQQAQQAQQQQGPQPQGGQDQGKKTVDADYKVVDEDEKKR
jgi:molecular chaperone DnaK